MLLKSLLLLTFHCITSGYAMRLTEKIYITTPPSDEQESPDLIAPEATNLAQYFQQQNSPQSNFFQKPDSLSPFLYSFMTVGPPKSTKQGYDQRETKNIERSSQNREENSYRLYRPDYEEGPQFVDMLPPPEAQHEPNYYGVKKRKNKKYSAADDKQKKYLKIKELKNNGRMDSQDYDYSDLTTETPHAEESQPSNYETFEVYTEPSTDSDKNRQERHLKSDEDYETQDETGESVETSAPSSRLDFHIHGHKGPKTYKFGYEFGKGNKRQFKIEERDKAGNVIGQYGYHNPDGSLRIVKYAADVKGGFKVL